MKEFKIHLSSVEQIQEFVTLSTTMGFPIQICDNRHTVAANSFMGMFCLNCCAPLTVYADCNDHRLDEYSSALQKFMLAD